MRLFCLERDNVTQPCDPDSDGDTYTSSFELFPFHEGATYSIYMGVYNGSGPYAGQFCAVRGMLDMEAAPAHWHGPISRAREAKRLAQEFNKALAYPAIFFNVPVLTRMETVSDFNNLFRCFKPHDKHLKSGECVTLEPFLDGSFRQFDQPVLSQDDQSKGVMTCPPGEPNIIEHAFGGMGADHMPSKLSNSSSTIAQAFTHFTWHATGSHIISGLQGILNGLTYTLTNPVVHSMGAQFGPSDGASQAISEFFQRHRCNNICRGWDKYEPHRNCRPQVNFLGDPATEHLLHNYRNHQNTPQHQRRHKLRNRDSDIKYRHNYYNYDNRSLPSAPPVSEDGEINTDV